jgi:hypothetical protein
MLPSISSKPQPNMLLLSVEVALGQPPPHREPHLVPLLVS